MEVNALICQYLQEGKDKFDENDVAIHQRLFNLDQSPFPIDNCTEHFKDNFSKNQKQFMASICVLEKSVTKMNTINRIKSINAMHTVSKHIKRHYQK